MSDATLQNGTDKAQCLIPWETVSVKLRTVPAYQSNASILLYTPLTQGGAYIDDDVIEAEAVVKPESIAHKYGASFLPVHRHSVNKWVEVNKPQKYRLWLSSKSPSVSTLYKTDSGGDIKILIAKVKCNDTDPMSRLESAQGQLLFAGICDKKDPELNRQNFNLIRGVELGIIPFGDMKDILLSFSKERLSSWKKALGAQRISAKELFNSLQCTVEQKKTRKREAKK